MTRGAAEKRRSPAGDIKSEETTLLGSGLPLTLARTCTCTSSPKLQGKC